MKIGIISDSHFGLGDDNEQVLESLSKIFEYFYETCLSENVDFAVHLGDLLHDRKRIGARTLKITNKIVNQCPVPFHILAGNHDFYFKDSPDICSFSELKFSKNQSVELYLRPEVKNIGSNKFLFLPWPGVYPEEIIQEFLRDKYDYVFAHLSVMDFQLIIGKSETSGFVPTQISNLGKQIFLGHFHIPQQRDNIMYVGSPMHFTRNDFNQTKRFVIFDTETGKIQEFSTNHLFSNILKIQNLNDLKKHHLKDSSVEFYFSPDKAESITPKEYESLVFGLKSLGVSKVNIKIKNFGSGSEDEFCDGDTEEFSEKFLSLLDILQQLVVFEAERRELNLSHQELKNYINVLYQYAEHQIILPGE